jgi:MSHA biogenesis protein MshI
VRWLSSARKQSGWMVIGVGGGELGAVHGEFAPSAKPWIHQYAMRAVDAHGAGLEAASRELSLGGYQCATLLDPGDYQVVVVDAPNVPRDELKSAIRWRVKDLLDFHVDDATIDVLDIPVPKDAPSSRNHSMYAVAARNEVIQARIKQFEDAAIPLSVIDIPETAQRNIAALYEESGRALAALYFDDGGGLMTINYQGELYLTRRFDVPLSEVAAPDESTREETRARVLLELQRSLDHFERQFRGIPVAKLLLGPEPAASGLAEYLGTSLGFPVHQIDLNEVLTIAGGAIEPRLQWRLFHLLGASLRHETRTL